MNESGDDTGRTVNSTTRRRLLAIGAGAAAASVAGCNGLVPGGDEQSGTTLETFRGSGPLVSGRPEPSGTSIEDLPDLSGTVTLYLGGGESGLYLDLLDLFAEEYSEFDYEYSRGSSSDLANTIIEEHEAGSTQADLFLAVDAGSLGAVAEAGATTTLSEDVLEPVDDAFQDGDGRWVGFAGRARAIPYNTNEVSEDEVPSSVADIPEFEPFQDAVGWAPSYGAFQSFVTAMRVSRGEDETRSWLQSMLDAGVEQYNNEWRVSNAVADGSLAGGFANHYYALRVQADRDEAPLALAFTEGDAGALVNVSGAEILSGTQNEDVASNLVRHLHSAEAQEFFATRTFAYPLIAGVEPVGDLPTIDELNPPDVDLTELSDVSATVDLMRDVGVL